MMTSLRQHVLQLRSFVLSPLTAVVLTYLLVAAIPTIVAIRTLGIRSNTLGLPMTYAGDGLGVAMNIKGIIEHGWYLTNESLGAPEGMKQHDYPGGDNLACFILKMLSYFSDNPFKIANLFLLFTYAAAAVTAYAALRHFGVLPETSLLSATLFALLPNHFYRGTSHLFYSAYFFAPLTVLLALWLAQGGFYASTEDQGLRRRRCALAMMVCAVGGSNGIYYPLFGAFILLIGGLYGAAIRHDRRAIVIAALLICVTAISFLANLLPVFWYLYHHGAAAFVARAPEESEYYALKLVQMLLPIDGHRIPFLANWRHTYDSRFPLVNENGSASLGTFGSVGLCVLLWTLLFQHTRGCGFDARKLMRPLSVIVGAAILLASVGGFSSLLALTVFAKIRGYNRISPYIAFCAITATAMLVDQFRTRIATERIRRTSFAAGVAVALVLGCLDQTSSRFVPDWVGVRAAFEADRRFFSQLAARLGAGAMVFQLPYVPYPEAGAVFQLTDYIPFRGYLHTRGLRWSYGANRGRAGDIWQQEVTHQRPKVFLRNIVFAGFTGIEIQRAGYPDGGAAIQRQISDIVGGDSLEDERHEFAMLDLREYARSIREQYSTVELHARAEQALNPLTISWAGGFSGVEEDEQRDWRWCSASGTLELNNPSPTLRNSRVQMRIVTCDREVSHLRIRSEFWNDVIVVDASGREYDRRLTIPPGSHKITFECDGKPAFARGDPREFVWRVDNFVLD